MTQGLFRLPHCFRSQTADRDSGITQRCGSNSRGLCPRSQVAAMRKHSSLTAQKPPYHLSSDSPAQKGRGIPTVYSFPCAPPNISEKQSPGEPV